MFLIHLAVQITMVLHSLFQPTVMKLSDAWRNSSRMSSQSWQMMLWSYLTTYLNIRLLRRSLVGGCTKHRFDPKSCPMFSYKVHIFWEGHKILQNLHQLFDWQYIGQIIGGDFAKSCGLLRIYELYLFIFTKKF